MELMNLFDMFSDETETATEVKAEEKKDGVVAEASENDEEQAQESASDVVVAETDEEDEDDGASEMTTGEEEDEADEKKKKASAPKSSKKKSVELVGPVKVVGLGWDYSYGESGKEYTPTAVLKACYAAGYKEVAFKDASITSDGKSAIFVSILGNSTMSYKYHDTDRIGKKISVEIGMNKAEYATADFGEDVSESEVSAFELSLKFVETHPDFKGFSLAVDRSIEVAVPYITNGKEKGITLTDGSDVIIYHDGGNVTSHVETDEEFRKEFADGYGDGTSVSFFKSDSDVIFAVLKGKEIITVKPETIVSGEYKKIENKAVEEVYHLPFVLVLPNLGVHKEMSANDFDGKTKVNKNSVLDFLKGQYTIFKSPNRQAIVDYEKSANIVSVMLAAGKKG